MNSSIFNSKKVPAGFILAAIAIFLAEIFVFTKAIAFVDRSRFCDRVKLELTKAGPDFDVVIFGASRTLALNAATLEVSAGGELSVYNLSVADLSAGSQFYLGLKQYLRYNKKPKLLLLSVVIEDFGNDIRGEIAIWPYTMDGAPIEDLGGGIDRYCDYFSLGLVLTSFPLPETAGLFKYYVGQVVPSIHYRDFIENVFPLSYMFDERVRGKKKKTRFEIQKVHREVEKSLRDRSGQMIFNKNELVTDDMIQRAMPENPKVYSEDKDKFIERFVALADENDIPVVFFFMPIISQRYEKMKELGWFDYAEKRFSEYENRYPNFMYYRDNRISYDKKYFGDWSHLNENGAERFSEDIAPHFQKILRELKMLPAGSST